MTGAGRGLAGVASKPLAVDLSDRLAWAERHTTVNRFGSKEYPAFVCHIMNLIDPRVRECGAECAWVAPFGWVPEAGCPVHD
jgi:hypothetical protein